MTKKNVLSFLLALLCCLLIGCAMALAVHVYDSLLDAPPPLEDGQTIDFSAYGFTLTVPHGYSLIDFTTSEFEAGGNALFAGCATDADNELYIYVYPNEQHDDIGAIDELALVSYYSAEGADEVRTRILGGRLFICFRVEAAQEDQIISWDSYETWNEDIHIAFETRMNPWDALSILQTITFTGNNL